MQKKKCFTLAELLVVISIIAILASLLLPALREAKLNAQMAICAKNLSQLSIATMSYENDYNGAIIPNGSCAGIWDNWNWDLTSMKNLMNYNDFSCLQCPVAVAKYVRPFAMSGIRSTYSQNKYLGDYTGSNSHIKNVTHKIRKPSETVFIFDGRQVISGGSNYPYAYSFAYLLSLSDEKPFWCHHGNSAQFLFKDGHVAAGKISDLTDSSNFWGD